MGKKIPLIIGAVVLFGIGFISSSVVAAKKAPRTVVVFAEYPLATDQWSVNGKIAAAGRALCAHKPSAEDWHVQLVRADGTKAELTIKTSVSVGHGFPFVGIESVDPLPGYNAGLHAEELSSSTAHQSEFSCQ